VGYQRSAISYSVFAFACCLQRADYHSMEMSDTVPSLDLIATQASGESAPMRIWIGKPVQEPTGEWSCAAGLEGLHPDLCAMRGEDALQAICLAMGLVATLLREHVAVGGRLKYPGGEDFPLEAYFGWLGAQAPRS
jgi:hypothetical protein